MNEWTEKPLSPSAIVDDEYLASVAKDLAQNEWTPPPLAPRAPAPRAQHVSKAALDRTISRLCTTLGRGIRQLVVEPLEKRIAELEAQRGLKYVGAWKPGGDYHPGEFVSYAGGIWHCKQHTGTPAEQMPRELATRSQKWAEMRTATELELLQRIKLRLNERLEVDRPTLERMVRAQHAGDPRMTELALAEFEAQIAKLPEQVLDELLAEPLKKERLH